MSSKKKSIQPVAAKDTQPAKRKRGGDESTTSTPATSSKSAVASASTSSTSASSSKSTKKTPTAAALPPVLGARHNAAWHDAHSRTRTGRAAIEGRDEEEESRQALQQMSTLDDDEDEGEEEMELDGDAEGEDEPEEEADELQIDDEDDGEDDEDEEEDEEEEGEDDESNSIPSTTDQDDDETSPESSTTKKLPSAAEIARANKRGIKIDVEEDDTIESKADVGNLAEGSDSSADEGEDGQSIKHRNRIGNVPLEWYNDYDHIGYDVTGKKIVKSAKGDKLEQLLARMDDPNWDRTIYDPVNDVSVVLTNDELDMITRLRKGQFAHASFDTSNPEYSLQTYTEDIRHEVLGQSIEPKRRFIPSKWEAKTVVKYVNAMRNGWMKLPSEVEAERKEKAKPQLYLLWGEDGTAIQDPKAYTPHRMPAKITAPKPPLPTHAESYNPPREYLPTQEEKEEWESMDPEDRPTNYLPQAFSSLRTVPAYQNLIKERFERCLDLYLCPRAKVKKLRNIDPKSLIPNLPKPSDLRPFPTTLTIEYRGHTGLIRSISLSPDGQWLASGSDDGTVRIFEVSTGRCFRKWDFKNQQTETDNSIVIEAVAFNPNPAIPLLAVCVGTHIFLLHTHTLTSGVEKKKIQDMLVQPSIEQQEVNRAQQTEKQIRQVKAVTWKVMDEITAETEDGTPLEPTTSLVSTESLLKKPEGEDVAKLTAATLGWSVLAIDCTYKVKNITWHHKGDYFASVSTINTDSSTVLIHRLTQHQTQSPFSKSKGLVMQVLFHPIKPFFFVMTKRHIRIYNLVTQSLVKKLLCPAKWLSSMSIHPGGDHILCGSFDRKICWYDLDLSSTPYKTLKYHSKAVRCVTYHSKSPLFASCSDDGNLHIFHGRVYDDLTTDPLIVPVKIIKAHEPVKDIGVLSCVFHPVEPWIFSSGADAVIRLFTC